MPRAAWVGAAVSGAAVGAVGMGLTGSRDPWSWALAIVVLSLAAPFHLRYLLGGRTEDAGDAGDGPDDRGRRA